MKLPWSARAARLPDDVRASLPLAAGERVIAAAQSPAGWVVATERALVTVDRRTPWTEVAHAQWLDEAQVLVVDPVPGLGPPVRITLPEPGRLPETVHERVMASIVLTRRLSLPRGSARVVARRAEGSDELVWQVVGEEGSDLDDPAVRRQVDEVVARLRREVG